MKYIPKVIHYCWFGGKEKPISVDNCIKSWKKYCPDYILKEWNEENFDIHSNRYVEEAYNSKKYAFVTDYVRLFALYSEGGIYMDTDVEVLKPLDIFLSENAFSSFENNDLIPTGIMGAKKGNKWIKSLLDEYKNLRFIRDDGSYDLTTNVHRITDITEKKFDLVRKSSFQKLKNGVVTIYPYDYFCPKDWKTGNINITKNTYTIHHFSGSWLSAEEKLKIDIIQKYSKLYNKKGYDEKKVERMSLFRYRIDFYLFHPKKLFNKIFEKVGKHR